MIRLCNWQVALWCLFGIIMRQLSAKEQPSVISEHFPGPVSAHDLAKKRPSSLTFDDFLSAEQLARRLNYWKLIAMIQRNAWPGSNANGLSDPRKNSSFSRSRFRILAFRSIHIRASKDREKVWPPQLPRLSLPSISNSHFHLRFPHCLPVTSVFYKLLSTCSFFISSFFCLLLMLIAHCLAFYRHGTKNKNHPPEENEPTNF